MESANQFSLMPPGGLIPPKGLNAAMEGLVREVLLKNPKNIYGFAADYFEKLINIRNMASSVENEEINNVVYYHQYNDHKNNNTTSPRTAKKIIYPTPHTTSNDNIAIEDETFDNEQTSHESPTNNLALQNSSPQQNSKINDTIIDNEVIKNRLDSLELKNVTESDETFDNTTIVSNLENNSSNIDNNNITQIADNIENNDSNHDADISTQNSINIENQNSELTITTNLDENLSADINEFNEKLNEHKLEDDNTNDDQEIVLKTNLEDSSNIESIHIVENVESNDHDELLTENVDIEESIDATADILKSEINEVISSIETDQISTAEQSNMVEKSSSETDITTNLTETMEITNVDEPSVELSTILTHTIEIPAEELSTTDEVHAEVLTVDELTGEVFIVAEKSDELPIDMQSTVETSAVDIPAVEELADVVPTIEELAVVEPTVEELAVTLPTDDVSQIEMSAVEELSVTVPTVELSTTEEALDELSIIEIPTDEDSKNDAIETIETVLSKVPVVEEPLDDERQSVEDVLILKSDDNGQTVIELSTTLNDEELDKSGTIIDDSEDFKLNEEILTELNDDPNEYELKISLENKSGNNALEDKNNKINADENLILEKYVTTIQKVFRGFITRKKMADILKERINFSSFTSKDKEKNLQGAYDSEQNYGITHTSIDPLLYTVPEEKVDSSSTEDESSTFSSAATKIQAGVRGFLTRKYFQHNKTNNSSDTTAPSIGEDSKSFEDLGNIESDDTVSKIIVATSSLLIEQLEHFEKLENKGSLSNKDTLDVNIEAEESLIRTRNKLRREDAIQLNSPCSSDETEKNKYSPGKTSEDDEPIGDLATSIITEIISNSYTIAAKDIDETTVANDLKDDSIVIDNIENLLKIDSSLEKVNDIAENIADLTDKDDHVDSAEDIELEDKKPTIVQSESFQSDDCDVVSGPIIIKAEQKSEPSNSPKHHADEDEIKPEIREIYPNPIIAEDHNVDVETIADSIPEASDLTKDTDASVKSDDGGTDSKKSLKEIKGLLHSGEFHDTIMLPTKVVRQSSHKSKGM